MTDKPQTTEDWVIWAWRPTEGTITRRDAVKEAINQAQIQARQQTITECAKICEDLKNQYRDGNLGLKGPSVYSRGAAVACHQCEDEIRGLLKK